MCGNESAGEVLFPPLEHVNVPLIRRKPWSRISSSLQRAHLYLHDWCQPALHAADHIATYFRLHRANSAAAQTPHRGRRGDPESRDRGEWSGRAGREDTSDQAPQNRCVEGLTWSELLGWRLAGVWSSEYLISWTCAVLKWLIASAGRSFSTPVADQLRLLPLLFKVKCNCSKMFWPKTSLDFLPIISLPSLPDCSSWERRQLRRTEERCQNLPVSDVSGTSLHRADPNGSQCSPGGKIPQSFYVFLCLGLTEAPIV